MCEMGIESHGTVVKNYHRLIKYIERQVITKNHQYMIIYKIQLKNIKSLIKMNFKEA